MDWKMQYYGASLYWRAAIMHSEKLREANPDLLRDKDVLEVACMRGGGARYLSEVTGPRRYVATDISEEHISECKRRHTPWPGLEFQVVDALRLADTFDAASFDFVICIQEAADFKDLREFVYGAGHVLRTGGRLILCDAFTREQIALIMDGLEDAGMQVDASINISKEVLAVGICGIAQNRTFIHLIASKAK